MRPRYTMRLYQWNGREAMTPEELKREDEFLEAQAKAIREHMEDKEKYKSLTDEWFIVGTSLSPDDFDWVERSPRD